MSSSTNISICSKALLLAGCDEINSFQDESRESNVANEIYGLWLDDLLTRHPWHFSRNQESLVQLVAEPLFDYSKAFQLPSGMLRLLKIESAAPYEIFEDKLYTNENTVNAVYQFRPPESTFPPYFERLLVMELAAVFAMAIGEDEKKSKMFFDLATLQERKARNTDSQQQPSRSIRNSNNILATVRI